MGKELLQLLKECSRWNAERLISKRKDNSNPSTSQHCLLKQSIYRMLGFLVLEEWVSLTSSYGLNSFHTC